MASESPFPPKIVLPMDIQEPGNQRWDWGLNTFSSKFMYVISSLVSYEGAKIQAAVPPNLTGMLEALEIMRKNLRPPRYYWLSLQISVFVILKKEAFNFKKWNNLIYQVTAWPGQWTQIYFSWEDCWWYSCNTSALRHHLAFHVENSIFIHIVW